MSEIERRKNNEYMKNYYATHPKYRKKTIKRLKQKYDENPEFYREKSRKWQKENPEYKNKWRLNNPDKVKNQNKRDNNSQTKKSSKEKYKTSIKGIKTIKEYTKKYRMSSKGIKYKKEWELKNPEYKKEWSKNNPRSSHTYSYDLQDAMNNVRVRDKNTCKWYNCGLTNRQAPIQVNHIFPRNEYPELELVEKYMICYCLNHHVMFHFYRGDKYYKLLASQNQTDINYNMEWMKNS